MVRDTRRLRHAEYLATAMRHRFCLVAPGDFASTHKVTEAMSIGGNGGCIPVFVLNAASAQRIDASRELVGVLPYAGHAPPPVTPPPVRRAAAAHPASRTRVRARGACRIPHPRLAPPRLRYTRWLDYCDVAYLVPSPAVGQGGFGAVLEKLAAVTADEAAAKLAALRRVRDAFVFRRGSTVEAPSAPEYMLGEMCHEARRAARGAESDAEEPAAGGDHARCVLGGDT